MGRKIPATTPSVNVCARRRASRRAQAETQALLAARASRSALLLMRTAA